MQDKLNVLKVNMKAEHTVQELKATVTELIDLLIEHEEENDKKFNELETPDFDSTRKELSEESA